MTDILEPKKPKIFSDLDSFVKQELALNNIPADAKYVIVAGVDDKVGQIMATVNLHKGEKFNTSIAAMWKHDWKDSNDTVAAKLVFVGK
jgi:hypothetical protein